MNSRIFEYNGRVYIGQTDAALIAQGVPEEVISQHHALARRDLIKAECRRRIYGLASAETQTNINGAAALVSAKTSAQRSAADAALLAAFSQSLQWITDMRAAVEQLDSDPASDYLADAAWPICPDEVIALVAAY